MNTRPDALIRRPQDVPQSSHDERIRNRRRALIEKEKFDPLMLQAQRLFTLDTSKPIEELIQQSYARSRLLRDMLTALTDGQSRKWPRQISATDRY